MEILVIDSRKREMRAFVASATKAQEKDECHQLVLRHALDVGNLADLLSNEEFRAEMPVLLMGEFKAQSSEGHVKIITEDTWQFATKTHRKVLVVGGLGAPFGKGGLKVLTNPIMSTLIAGPVKIKNLQTAGNSNCSSAYAARRGAEFLSSLDKEVVFLVEGQSDKAVIVRLKSEAEEMPSFPAEHQEEMFSRESIVKKMIFSQSWRALKEWKGDENPSDEEVQNEVEKRIMIYLEYRREGNNPACSLGRGFDHIAMLDGIITDLAEQFGVVLPPKKVVA